jgi:hypothetical protein
MHIILQQTSICWSSMRKDLWQTDGIQISKAIRSPSKVFNIFLMFEICIVSSQGTSHSQFGIQNQLFGIPWILGLKKYLWFRFPTNPIFFCWPYYFFQCYWPCDPIFSGWLRAAYTVCQTKLPKFVHRKYASLINIDVGTLLKIAQQKTAKTMKKIFKKKCISYLPTLIFSRYETGTTGIFFRPSDTGNFRPWLTATYNERIWYFLTLIIAGWPPSIYIIFQNVLCSV